MDDPHALVVVGVAPRAQHHRAEPERADPDPGAPEDAVGDHSDSSSVTNCRRHSTDALSACTLTSAVASSGSTPGHPLQHALVLGADRLVEAQHLVGRHGEVVVAPDDEREQRRHVVHRRAEQQQDVVEPGLVVDRAAHGERQVEPGRHPPGQHLRGQPADGGTEGVVVDVRPRSCSRRSSSSSVPQLDLRHVRLLRQPERAGVDEREVRDVDEVVRHPGRRRPPQLDVDVEPAVGGVGVLRDLGDAGRRLAGAHPDEAVALGDVHRRQVRLGRHRDALVGRRHEHAAAAGPERPAVVRALAADHPSAGRATAAPRGAGSGPARRRRRRPRPATARTARRAASRRAGRGPGPGSGRRRTRSGAGPVDRRTATSSSLHDLELVGGQRRRDVLADESHDVRRPPLPQRRRTDPEERASAGWPSAVSPCPCPPHS